MTWFKVDDTLALHPKVLSAGNAAIGLWVRAGAWSMQQLTDGFVPTHVARTLGSPTEARRLVAAGLWLEVDGGFSFHEWTDVQRTKEQVKADREAAADRQRHARERAKSQRESRRDKGVSHGPPDQTRPDQTSKDIPPTEGGADKPPRSTKRRATTLPPAWEPTDTHRQIAIEERVNFDAEAARFRDDVTAKGRTYVDWDAAFRNWLRSPYANRSPLAPVRRLPHARDIEQPPNGLSDEQMAAWMEARA